MNASRICDRAGLSYSKNYPHIKDTADEICN